MIPPTPLKLSLGLAVDASERGDHHYAVWAMRWMMKFDAEKTQLLARHPSPSVRWDFLQSKAATPREYEIYKPCSILGEVGSELTARQKRTIRSILNNHWDDWSDGHHTAPRYSTIYDVTGNVSLGEKPKIAMVFPKYIKSSDKNIESDFYYHYLRSAEAAGFEVHGFAADGILYEPSRPLAEAAKQLTDFLESVRPDIVIFDGNFKVSPTTIGPDYWREQKTNLWFKLVACVGDCYDMPSSFSAPWYECCDQVIIYHTPSVQMLNNENCVLFPSIPFHDTSFTRASVKDIGLVSIGSNTRGRFTWMEALAAAGLPIYSALHDRSSEVAPSREEYAALLSRSRLLFNNGFVRDGVSIVTGRFFEGVLSGNLVLEEVGSPIDSYFIPFIHYIPVANASQAIIFSRFFLEEEAWRARIADAAYAHWKQHYSSERAWQYLCSRLF